MSIPERESPPLTPEEAAAPIRPTVATIDLDALKHNFRQLEAFAGPSQVLAIVKANAYGHGLIPCARALAEAGAPFLGVALVEEGLELRQAGIATRMLVLGGSYGESWDTLVGEEMTPLVFQKAHIEGLAAAARRQGKKARAHLKLDTGMGRVGIAPEELLAFLDAAQAHGVELEGLATHFANADLADSALTEKQIETMDEAVGAMRARGQEPKWVHMANSAATVSRPRAHGTLVRPGIMLYGAYPSESYRDRVALRPVMRWTTRISHVKAVGVGTPISYGSKWVAKRPSVIATLPLGYADGYQRRLTNVGSVLLRGRRVPITGTVCMDQCMIDVTDLQGVQVGEEVVLLGRQGQDEIRADELAQACGTIHYEIFCGISARVPRCFVDAS